MDDFVQERAFLGHFLGTFWALDPMLRYFEHPNRVCRIGQDYSKPGSQQAPKYMGFWLTYGPFKFAYF